MKKILSAFLITSTIIAYGQNPRVKPIQTNPDTKTPANNASPQIQSNNGVNESSRTASASSKHELKNIGIFNLSGILGLPEGEFKSTSNNWGYGISGKLAYNPFNQVLNGDYIRPFLIGIEVQYLWFGSKSDDYNLNNDPYYVTEATSKVSSGAFGIGLTGRCEFISHVVYPFVEYSAGFRFFNGSNDVTITRTPRPGVFGGSIQTNNVSENLESSIVGYLGFGGGIGFSLTDNARMELKLQYQNGGRATYIDPESITFSSNKISYNTKTSRTSMFIPYFGFCFIF